MSFITRGFTARSRERDPRLPRGQTKVEDWPVLSAGPTPKIDPAVWSFTVTTETGAQTQWSWDELRALGLEDIETDIHCVTHWSKLAMSWRGVPLDKILAGIPTHAGFAMANSYGGYTTNIPLPELLNGQAWVAFEADGAALEPEHGGPARLLIPHLYFWKSAKWVSGITLMESNDPGFWEQSGYSLHGDPWKEERYW